MNITGMVPSATCRFISSVAVIFSFSAAYIKREEDQDTIVASILYMQIRINSLKHS